MIRFSVPDISCDACVRSITAAVARVDSAAKVRVDLATLTVDIDSGLPAPAFSAAIEDAGFSPRPAGPSA